MTMMRHHDAKRATLHRTFGVKILQKIEYYQGEVIHQKRTQEKEPEKVVKKVIVSYQGKSK
jgi:hypothetical protein